MVHRLKNNVFFTLIAGFWGSILFAGYGYPFQILQGSKNPFDSYQRHIDDIKNYMNTFQIETIEFPVQETFDHPKTFIRKGLLTLRPKALGTVIICHGYTHSKHEAFFFRTLFPHFHVLAFDFRAHGELTDGQFSTVGRDEMLDVKGAVDFVKAHPELQDGPIIGFGFSMGAVSLLEAQAKYPDLFDILILDSPFDSSSDCMGRRIEEMLTINFWGKKYILPGKELMLKALYNPRFRLMVKYIFKWSTGMNPNVARTKFVPVIPIEHAKHIKVPCFFISCENDRQVTVDCVRRLYDAVSSEYKRFWIAHGIKHCGSCLAQPELYSYRLNNFIKHALDGSWSENHKIHDDRVVITAV